jgi:rhomboid protease GluP
MIKRAPVTMLLLAVIATVWGFQVAGGKEQLIELGGILPWRYMDGQYWRLLTAVFLHGGWLHWFANSWAIYQLGSLYEVLFGSKRFALIFFVSGICASFASSLHVEGVGVGASGGVFGILGAFVFSIWRSPQYRRQPWTKNLLGQLLFWTVINLYIGFQLPFIDNVAHVGGLAAGLLLGFIPHRVPPPPPGESVIEVQPYDDGTSLPP